QNAKGVDDEPKRRLEYSADHLTVHYNEDGDVDKVTGEPNARVVSSTEYSRTTTTTDRIDLEFESKNHETALKTAYAHGHALLESKPITAAPGGQLPDTRVLRSELIEMKMRPGSREIETVSTLEAGQVEFIPNQPGGRRRQMDGARIYITYGQRNLIQSFPAIKVATRRDPPTPKGPSRTWSDDLRADFDPKTGQMVRMKQWNNFRYVEGARQAVAAEAMLEQDSSRITLTNAARV